MSFWDRGAGETCRRIYKTDVTFIDEDDKADFLRQSNEALTAARRGQFQSPPEWTPSSSDTSNMANNEREIPIPEVNLRSSKSIRRNASPKHNIQTEKFPDNLIVTARVSLAGIALKTPCNN